MHSDSNNSKNNKSKYITNINILANKSKVKLILPKKIIYSKFSNIKRHNKVMTQVKLFHDKINIEDYDALPYKTALKFDNRNIFKLFLLKIFEKLEIIDIFYNRKFKSILLNKYFLYLLLDFLLNALLYSDKVVSHKSHNNGKLEFIVVLTITLSSKIILSVIRYFLNYLIEFQEKLNLIVEIRDEFIFYKILKKFIREIVIKKILFLVIECAIILFSFYYLLIFCWIYKKSQISLLLNYLTSLLEDIIISFIIVIIIIFSRKIGLYYKNKYFYNTSKYIDTHF